MAKWECEQDEVSGQWYVLEDGQLFGIADTQEDAIASSLEYVRARKLEKAK